jgi:predicted kinase
MTNQVLKKMNKPLLVVVTGRPASGKTTLAHILTNELKCPLLSRDELKEGYLNTAGTQHSQLDQAVTWHIYDTFFEAIDLLLSKGISIIVEAAFQDKSWKPKLLNLVDKAVIKIIVCNLAEDIAESRFASRLLDDPNRVKFHGDNLVKEQKGVLTETYEPPQMDVPILEVDTNENWKPTVKEIISFIKQQNSR